MLRFASSVVNPQPFPIPPLARPARVPFLPCGAAGDHNPPLKLYGVPARYANATYTAASKAGELEVVQRDLDAFQHVREPWLRVRVRVRVGVTVAACFVINCRLRGAFPVGCRARAGVSILWCVGN